MREALSTTPDHPHRSPLNAIKSRLASRYWRLDDVVVALRGRLEDLPPRRGFAPLRVREMDTAREADVCAWLEVYRQAFGTLWDISDFERDMLNHPTLELRHTFLVEDGCRVLAAASVGVFRRNPRVGVGHMIGVAESGRGRGLGKALALHRYHTLREEGFELAESETTLRHQRSLLMHFGCGFRPKRQLEAWNTPDPIGGIDRLLVDLRLARLYRLYARGRAAGRGAP